MNGTQASLPGLNPSDILKFIFKVDLTKVAPTIKAFLDLLTLIHDGKYGEAVAKFDELAKLISGLIPASAKPQVAGSSLDNAS